MVTIQPFIFNEAKGQLGVGGRHKASLNKILLEVCMLPFWDLGEKNRNQFEHYHILDGFPFEELQKTPTSLIQKCFQTIAKNYAVMLAGGETTSRCFSREEPILGIFSLAFNERDWEGSWFKTKMRVPALGVHLPKNKLTNLRVPSP